MPSHPNNTAKKNDLLFNSDSETRSSPRYPANDLAQILFDNQSLGCLIHNISKNGAMIETSTSQVPDRFILVNYVTKMRMACEIKWQRNLHFGVRFVTIPKSFHDSFE